MPSPRVNITERAYLVTRDLATVNAVRRALGDVLLIEDPNGKELLAAAFRNIEDLSSHLRKRLRIVG